MKQFFGSLCKQSSSWWFDRLCLAAVVLSCALTMSPNQADADLWGHVQYGTDALRDGLPATATYTYTAEGYRWINHENLSELLMALTFLTVGPLGLVWGKCLLGLLVIGLIIRGNLRDGVGWIAAGIVALLVAANLSYHWSIRPQLASMVCYTLLIALLQFSFRGWRGQWLWTSPRRWGRADWQPGDDRLNYDSRRLKALWLAIPLFVLWVNSHGGFLAGLAVYLLYLSVRAVEAICQRGRSGWGLVRRMALMGFGAVLACFINPYGPALVRWIFFSVGHARPEISDWSHSPLWSLVGMKFWAMIAIGGVAVWGSRRKLDLAQTLVIAFTLWQSLSHFRHVPFFAIAAGFWMGPHLQATMQRLARRLGNTSETRSYARLNVAVGTVLFWIGLALASRLSDLAVPRDEYPVAAVQYMVDHRLSGRLVVSFDWAQYALVALAADPNVPRAERTTIAFDGRFRTCYPQFLIDGFFDFTYGDVPQVQRNRFGKNTPIDPFWILEYGRPDLVLLERQGENTSAHMQMAADQWILLYQDSIAQVWGRKDIFDDTRHFRYLPPASRLIGDEVQVGSVRWPALPRQPISDNLVSLAH